MVGDPVTHRLAAVVDAVCDHRPAIVEPATDDVDLVPPLRSMLVLPKRTRCRVDRKADGVSVAVRPNLRKRAFAADERVIQRDCAISVSYTHLLGTAGALALYGLARDPAVGLVASALAGASWIAVLANLNVSAQVALPNWVRGRGLALFVTVFFGTMTLGSAVWGEVASALGLPLAHFVAAAGALLAVPLTWSCLLYTSRCV